jgi:hypothetical protein
MKRKLSLVLILLLLVGVGAGVYAWWFSGVTGNVANETGNNVNVGVARGVPTVIDVDAARDAAGLTLIPVGALAFNNHYATDREAVVFQFEVEWDEIDTTGTLLTGITENLTVASSNVVLTRSAAGALVTGAGTLTQAELNALVNIDIRVGTIAQPTQAASAGGVVTGGTAIGTGTNIVLNGAVVYIAVIVTIAAPTGTPAVQNLIARQLMGGTVSFNLAFGITGLPVNP